MKKDRVFDELLYFINVILSFNSVKILFRFTFNSFLYTAAEFLRYYGPCYQSKNMKILYISFSPVGIEHTTIAFTVIRLYPCATAASCSQSMAISTHQKVKRAIKQYVLACTKYKYTRERLLRTEQPIYQHIMTVRPPGGPQHQAAAVQQQRGRVPDAGAAAAAGRAPPRHHAQPAAHAHHGRPGGEVSAAPSTNDLHLPMTY